MNAPVEEIQTEVLVLGSGGAGLMAALYALDTNPKLDVTLATKGLFGKSGCTRMVQGGYNVVLSSGDSIERHFQDTMIGGHWLNNHILARTLVEDAPVVVHEMWLKAGVRFARDEHGNLHQKGLAGQTFDRTVHHGDLTGIEIVSRLSEQVRARGARILEECRALDLLVHDGEVEGALLLHSATGKFLVARAGITVLATGGSAPIFAVSSASLEKCGDGYALAYRAGATLMDMEMSQFHPTGLIAPGSRLNGSVIAEELRAAGGYLYNVNHERFMERYNPQRIERATRDEVSRGCYFEIAQGRGTGNGGVWLDVSHLGAAQVEALFPGMLERCLLIGRDLRKEPIEVCPTSHFQMGGVRIDRDCHSDLPGLLVAGEDSGGVHGANRLGGNGVADSTVYGRRAGLYAAHTVGQRRKGRVDPAPLIARALAPWERDGERPQPLHAEFRKAMWENVGVVRDATGMRRAVAALETLQGRAERTRVEGSRRYNLTWHSALDVQNAILVGRMVAQSALIREESRGAHYRSDFPSEEPAWTRNITLRRTGEEMGFSQQDVVREPATAAPA